MCGTLKDASGFYPNRWHKDGLSSQCMACVKFKAMEWNNLNPEKAKAHTSRWQKQNPEKIKEVHRLYKMNNRKRTNERNRIWRANNPSTPKAKLNSNVCRGINRSIRKGTKEERHWENLMDYTIDQLKTHLEKMFKPGMTWENYGSYWEIDHIVPVAVFNFGKPEDLDFRLCWSLKNLQPLEARENREKGKKIDKPFQPSLMMGY